MYIIYGRRQKTFSHAINSIKHSSDNSQTRGNSTQTKGAAPPPVNDKPEWTRPPKIPIRVYERFKQVRRELQLSTADTLDLLIDLYEDVKRGEC